MYYDMLYHIHICMSIKLRCTLVAFEIALLLFFVVILALIGLD